MIDLGGAIFIFILGMLAGAALVGGHLLFERRHADRVFKSDNVIPLPLALRRIERDRDDDGPRAA